MGSANIGVFLCLKCCGVHRSLDTHISKVLSVTLDEWSDDEIEAMFEVGGNASANSIYEAYLPEGVLKPKTDASHEEHLKFVSSFQENVAKSLLVLGPHASVVMVGETEGEEGGPFVGVLLAKIPRF
ncbi:ADP-ribosylation factor GTPase-activating protein agd12 [Orobanche hederae]